MKQHEQELTSFTLEKLDREISETLKFLEGRYKTSLTASDKIKIYEAAQHKYDQKLVKLEKNYLTDSNWFKQLGDLKIRRAIEIFSHTNSAPKMGQNQFDFHGLAVYEARVMAHWITKKKLPVEKRINIITGQGRHSKQKSRPLQEAMQRYFKSLRIKCHIASDNEGILVISK